MQISVIYSQVPEDNQKIHKNFIVSNTLLLQKLND